jgi:predicted O-methyltransferase YrrM
MSTLVTEYNIRGTVVPLQNRWDVVRLVADQGIGIELGTAGAGFARRILEISNLSFLYTVDHFDKEQAEDAYIHALYQLLPFKTKSTVLRTTFATATRLFTNDSFDFIYVDGYAHTGQENGGTFQDWWPKLKSGGVFAGDDYHAHWPDVIKNLDAFADKVNHEVYVINCTPGEDCFSQYPTWFIIKK